MFLHISVRHKIGANRNAIGVLEVAIRFQRWQERYFLRHFCEFEHFGDSSFAFERLSFNFILFFDISILILFASQLGQRVLEFLPSLSDQLPCFFGLPIGHTRYLMEHIYFYCYIIFLLFYFISAAL